MFSLFWKIKISLNYTHTHVPDNSNGLTSAAGFLPVSESSAVQRAWSTGRVQVDDMLSVHFSGLRCKKVPVSLAKYLEGTNTTPSPK